jgi:hypothetical protein
MNKMKKNIILIIVSLVSLLTGASTAIANDPEQISKENYPEKVQAITGTWINLAYKDVRNKYTNPKYFDNTDPQLWECKVRELSKMGIEYLIFMEVANMGKAYYPSKLMPWIYNKNSKSPVEAILDEAAKQNMKVFISTGWAKDQDDDLRDPDIKERQLQIMEELASLYKNHNAFFGWYLPVEDCFCPILKEHAVESVNILTDRARTLTPGKKTLISPYGIGLSEFDHPDYEKQLAKLNVDIIAYQDEVGCLRDQFTLPRLKENWKKLRDIHNRLKIEMWANCETFTWENATNDRNSALIPASYSRLLSQQVAASNASVDRIISFMFPGIIEDPDSPYQLGQSIWSGKTYKDYMDWKNGARYWKLFEASLQQKLINSAIPSMIEGNCKIQALLDGKVAEENSNDQNWVKFDEGYHELTIDLKQKSRINEVFLHMLNYNLESINSPLKVYLSISDDGISYKLMSIKDAVYFPNNKHDAWIDPLLFSQISENTRYIKIAFYTSDQVYIDELFINPEII